MAIVRQHHPHDGSRRPAELVPGDLVWANIANGDENPLARGKARPAIVEADGWAWKMIGLTTRRLHGDETPRVVIPNAHAAGLRQLGWLWAGTLCTVSGLDVGHHVGRIDQALVFEVAKLGCLDGPSMKTLLLTALAHHRTPASPLQVVDEP
jgi:hypothetical protein